MKQAVLDNQLAARNTDRINVISMLYDGAVNFIKNAKEKTEIGDIAGKTLYIRKTSAIISELSNSLNMDGGDIAQNLRKLYEFVQDSLFKAELQNDVKAIDDAEKVIEILKDAWYEMQKAKSV